MLEAQKIYIKDQHHPKMLPCPQGERKETTQLGGHKLPSWLPPMDDGATGQVIEEQQHPNPFPGVGQIFVRFNFKLPIYIDEKLEEGQKQTPNILSQDKARHGKWDELWMQEAAVSL